MNVPRPEEMPYEARLELARDPASAAALLDALLTDAEARLNRTARPDLARENTRRENRVREAVAGNPNTPAPLLASLATVFPEAFAQNPVAPLLPLEDPAFARRLDRNHLTALLRLPELPLTLLSAIAGQHPDPYAREEASLHVQLGGELSPETWRTEMTAYLRRAAADLQGEDAVNLRALIAHEKAPAWLNDSGLPPPDDAGARATTLGNVLTHRREWAAVPPLLRLLLLAHHTVGASDLRVRFRGEHPEPPDWWERLGAVLNPDSYDAWDEVLADLILDGNRFVRAAADARLANPRGRFL